jgi:hypothetical protein
VYAFDFCVYSTASVCAEKEGNYCIFVRRENEHRSNANDNCETCEKIPKNAELRSACWRRFAYEFTAEHGTDTREPI